LPSFLSLSRFFSQKRKIEMATIDPLAPTRQISNQLLPVQEQPTVIHNESSVKMPIQEQKMNKPSGAYSQNTNSNQKFLGREPIRTISSEAKTVGKIGRGKEVSVHVELAHLIFEDLDTHKQTLRPPRVFVIISCGRGQIILNVEESKALSGMLSGVLPDAIYQDRMLIENRNDKVQT